jgi:hypothetical protein
VEEGFIAQKPRDGAAVLSAQADRLAGARREEGALGCSARNDGGVVPQKPSVGLRLSLRMGQAAKPGKQGCEMRPVLLRHAREPQSKSFTRLNMPHDRVGPDLSFLDEKIELGFRSHRAWTCGSYKQTSRAQVPDAGNFIPAITTPADPDVVRRLGASGMAPRKGRCLRSERHKAP